MEPFPPSVFRFGELAAFYFIFTILVKIALIFAVTIGIWGDAWRLREIGAGTLFLGPFGWAVVAFCASLLGSAFGAVALIGTYWLIHHSSLRRDAPPVAIAVPRPPVR